MSNDRERIQRIITDVVDEHLAGADPRDFDRDEPQFSGRDLITEEHVMKAHRRGEPLVVREGAIMTPLARDAIDRYRVVVTDDAAPSGIPRRDGEQRTTATVIIGSDHGGFEMKQKLASFLESEAGIRCEDVGTFDEAACDYPDFAGAVADKVASRPGLRGIIVDGAGIGSCMVANKTHGIRAAHCSSVAEANNAREHNDANVLCLGGRMIPEKLCQAIAIIFLTTDFGGGRHQGRVDKIMKRER